MSAGIIEQIVLIFLICVLAPLIEEVIFRGYIYRFIKEEYGVWPSVVSTIILFNIAHGGTQLFSYQLAVISLVAIYSYEESGSITGSIAYHMFHNTAYTVLVFGGMYYQSNGSP